MIILRGKEEDIEFQCLLWNQQIRWECKTWGEWYSILKLWYFLILCIKFKKRGLGNKSIFFFGLEKALSQIFINHVHGPCDKLKLPFWVLYTCINSHQGPWDQFVKIPLEAKAIQYTKSIILYWFINQNLHFKYINLFEIHVISLVIITLLLYAHIYDNRPGQ